MIAKRTKSRIFNAQMPLPRMKKLVCAGCALLLVAGSIVFSNFSVPAPDETYTGWAHYGGTKDAARYSSLTQITPQNVQQLQVAWTYRTGDATERSQIQCQPIVIDGVLYATSPQLKVLALNAATGQEVWRTDLSTYWGGENAWAGTNRGVTYWSDGKDDKRILVAAGNYLLCLNATTGKPVESFGEGGRIDLQKNLDYHRDKFFIVSNTPGIIYKDLIIMGMRLSEGLDAAPGHVRAFDVRTGKRRWIFHTIPHPGEFGYETWKDKNAWKTHGAANNWAGMSLDEKRGIVYVPTGSAGYDFYGGDRKGDNLFSNCILALDAATGKRLWHFQTVHHDLWDRDLPANPNLVTIQKDGRTIDAVAQITKHGQIFVLDRVTGKPVFPIREVPMPTNGLPGEEVAKTQPLPTLPQPIMRQQFLEKDIIDISPEHHAEILARYKPLKPANNMFIPPSEQGHVLFPGFDGGGEWGGASFDPNTNILYVNANEMPWIMQMKRNPKVKGSGLLALGSNLYTASCANCHGLDRKGNGGAFPALIDLQRKHTPESIAKLLQSGKGAMPAFKQYGEKERAALATFLLNLKEAPPTEKKEVEAADVPDVLIPEYVMTGYNRFMTKDGYPAIKPPWGTLNAVNLNTGKILWKVPLGEFEQLSKKGIPKTGTENYGGPVTTAGGLIFIGATQDEYFRVFDKKTGQELWKYKLPAGGYATPACYSVNGKQYVVIACGGGKMGTKSGDSYVAFALP